MGDADYKSRTRQACASCALLRCAAPGCTAPCATGGRCLPCTAVCDGPLWPEHMLQLPVITWRSCAIVCAAGQVLSRAAGAGRSLSASRLKLCHGTTLCLCRPPCCLPALASCALQLQVQPAHHGRLSMAASRAADLGRPRLLVQMAAWKVAPALAAGCTCVVKPSEYASVTCLELGDIASKAGLPPGVLNILTGLGSAAGAPLRCALWASGAVPLARSAWLQPEHDLDLSPQTEQRCLQQP